MDEMSILNRMIAASKEDRERFFAIADTLSVQPSYKDKLRDIEHVKQQWRDMTALPNYPSIKWPLELPDWFPPIKFASSWGESYLSECKWHIDLMPAGRTSEVLRPDGFPRC